MAQLSVWDTSTTGAEFQAIIEGGWSRALVEVPATAKLRPTRHEPDPEQTEPEQTEPEPDPGEHPERPGEETGADKLNT